MSQWYLTNRLRKGHHSISSWNLRLTSVTSSYSFPFLLYYTISFSARVSHDISMFLQVVEERLGHSTATPELVSFHLYIFHLLQHHFSQLYFSITHFLVALCALMMLVKFLHSGAWISGKAFKLCSLSYCQLPPLSLWRKPSLQLSVVGLRHRDCW